MERGVPCCAADAARRTRKIRVGGNLIAISQYDQIMREVREEGLEREEDIKASLLRQARIYNHMPPRAEGPYADALLGEYKKTITQQEDRDR